MVGYAGIRPISLLDDPPEKRLPFDGEFHQGGYKKKKREKGPVFERVQVGVQLQVFSILCRWPTRVVESY